MKSIRKLKIQPKFRSQARDYVCIPEIRIAGKWLQKLGFNQGQTVCIEQAEKRLIITLEEKEKSSKTSS